MRTITFVTILCLVCALILSLLASLLKEPQTRAEELYQSKQLLIAAGIITPIGTLVTTGKDVSSDEILEIYRSRVHPMLTDSSGNTQTFQQAGINQDEYMILHKDTGFAKLKNKLVYVISSDDGSKTPYGFVIPINGYGLWDAIYGYIGIKSDGDTVIGTTWYDQKETPGLGAEIATVDWQSQFHDKKIFNVMPDGAVDEKTAPIGIKVVKTTVADELGSSPQAVNAIDGIAGATITSKGVAAAYKDSLTPYREFLIKAGGS